MKKLVVTFLLMAVCFLPACGNSADQDPGTASPQTSVPVSQPSEEPSLSPDHSHTFGDWVVVEATCEAAGNQSRTCEDCGYMETVAIDAAGHVPGEWVVSSTASCTESGYSSRSCTVCGKEVESETAAKLGHSYESWTTTATPTCTETGLQVRTCEVCGIQDEQLISATGHTPGDWKVLNNPTCTEAGTRAQLCSSCQAQIGTETIAATGHTQGDWVVVVEPTKTEAGRRVVNCSACGTPLKEETIAALGYSADDISIDLPRTPVTITFTTIFNPTIGEFEYYKWAKLTSISYEVTSLNRNNCTIELTVTFKNLGIGDNGIVTNPGPEFGSEILLVLLDQDGNIVQEIFAGQHDLLKGHSVTKTIRETLPYGDYTLRAANYYTDTGSYSIPPSHWMEIIN